MLFFTKFKYHQYIKLKHTLKILFLFWFLLLVIGCQNSGKLRLNISAANNINQDRFGQALPLVINCYQLTSCDSFNNADFNKLWKQSEQILDKDLLSSEEIKVQPDSKKDIVINLEPKIKHFACMGLFNIPEDNWRTVLPINRDIFRQDVELNIINKKISLTKVKR